MNEKPVKLSARHRLRSPAIVDSWNRVNDGTRTLLESSLIPEVAQALKSWGAHGPVNQCVLIGGMAFSYWARPRATSDADFLFLGTSQVPQEIPGFKRIRPHAFQHSKTHVEIEVLDPEFLGMAHAIALHIFSTAITHNGMRIASREGLIVSKLGRFSRRDQGDIEDLLVDAKPDFSGWQLPDLYWNRLSEFGIQKL